MNVIFKWDYMMLTKGIFTNTFLKKNIKNPIRQAPIKAQTRRIKPIKINGKIIYLIANNNAKMMALSHHSNLKL